jgi:hypothetical protein
MILALSLATIANAQQVASKPSTDPIAPTRSCAVEGGMTVCRDVAPGAPATADAEAAEAAAVVRPAPQAKGRLLMLLDIPQDIFARLSQDPAKNREYHAKKSWDYRPKPPAPARADQYAPLLINGVPPWKYTPKASFAYTPKRDWSYNRDVFGRIWRQNIQHDTRVAVVPVEKPGVYLMPVGEGR